MTAGTHFINDRAAAALSHTAVASGKDTVVRKLNSVSLLLLAVLLLCCSTGLPPWYCFCEQLQAVSKPAAAALSGEPLLMSAREVGTTGTDMTSKPLRVRVADDFHSGRNDETALKFRNDDHTSNERQKLNGRPALKQATIGMPDPNIPTGVRLLGGSMPEPALADPAPRSDDSVLFARKVGTAGADRAPAVADGSCYYNNCTVASLSTAFAQKREDNIMSAREVGTTGTDTTSKPLRVRVAEDFHSGRNDETALKFRNDDNTSNEHQKLNGRPALKQATIGMPDPNIPTGVRLLSGAIGSFSAGGHRTYGYGPPAAYKSIKFWEDIDTELRWPYPPTKFQKRKPIPNWNKKAYAPPMDSNHMLLRMLLRS